MSKPTAIHEIIEDPAAMTITVGPKVFDRPVLWRYREWDTAIKEQIVDRPMTGDVKALNAFYCAQLGPKFNRRFQAANYYMWIGNRMSPITGNMLHRHGSTGWRHYSDELVYKANQVLPYIREAEADGLYHLIPAIVIFQASPSAIKREIGKGAWKRIAANSRTRNMRIMQMVEKTDGGEISGKEAFIKFLDVRSGLLGGMGWCNHETLLAARLAPRSTVLSLLETQHIVRDATRMLGSINPAWGLARIKREHDAAILEKRRQHYSPEAFDADWSHEEAGFVAELLVSPLAIVTEGDIQHHCVGSYAHDARRGVYAVMKVEGNERATIGLMRTPQGWQVDQVYAACNAPVSPACRDFAFKVANKLTAERLQEKAA